MRKKVAFVGSFVSQEESLTDKRYSQAANAFQEKFIEFVKPDLIVSVLPLFSIKKNYTYPTNDVVFVISEAGLFGKLKKLLRVCLDTKKVVQEVVNSRSTHVIFYNLEIQNYLSVLVLFYFFRKEVFIVAADYIGGDRWGFSWLVGWLIKKLDGVLVLNSNIVCNSNTITMPGLLRKSVIHKPVNGAIEKKVILSGSLGYTTGLVVALECFSMLPDFELHITGKPFRMEETELLELISRYSAINKNIFYHGLLEYSDYRNVLSGCDIALSLRNPNDKEHLFNFPSKILEYLSFSKIVVSSMPYADLPQGLVFYSEFDPQSLKSVLLKILGQAESTIYDIKSACYDLLINEFTEDVVVRRVNALVEKGYKVN